MKPQSKLLLILGVFVSMMLMLRNANGQAYQVPNTNVWYYDKYNTGDGNIGIGTSSPSEKLTVNGPIRGHLSGGAVQVKTSYGTMDFGPLNANYAHFITDRPQFYFNKPIRVNLGIISSYNANLTLQTSGNTRMTMLNSNGYVGIGTTSPGALLDVNGKVRTKTHLHVGENYDAVNGRGLTVDNGASTGWNLFRLKNNSGTHINVLGNGRVGIGTETPSTLLDVNGTLRFRSLTQNDALTRVLVSDASGNLSYRDASTLGSSGGGSSLWMTSGSTVYYNGGNIGVGTNSPNARLHIANVSNTWTGNGWGKAMQLDAHDAIAFRTAEGRYFAMGAKENNRFFLGSTGNEDNTGGGMSYALTILDNGNVGLGSTSPTADLHISSSTTDSELLIEADTDNNNENDNPFITFSQDGYPVGFVGLVGDNNMAPQIQKYARYEQDENNNWVQKHDYIGTLANSLFVGTNNGNNVQFGTQGNIRMSIMGDGKIGIGRNNPAYELDVDGTIANNAILLNNHFGDLRMRRFGSNDNTWKRALVPSATQLTINYGGDFSAGARVMGSQLLVDGKVAIGTTNMPGNHKLYVDGSIMAEKVKVAIEGTSNWADFVFSDDYQLRSLDQVENFIQENKHLPDVPSAKEVVESGVDLATMDVTLLQKIEELTLYVIKQGKAIEAMKVENARLKSAMLKLTASEK